MLASHYANILAVEESTRRKTAAEYEKIIDHKSCHVMINKLTKELEIIRGEMNRVDGLNLRVRE